MPTTASLLPSDNGPEKAAELLRRYQRGDDQAGHDLIVLLDSYFKTKLRHILIKSFPTAGKDATARFSAMVNEFFLSILQGKVKGIYDAKSLQDLLNLASVVIRRDMLNVISARGRRTKLQQDYYDRVIKPQSDHFTKDSSLDFECVLNVLEDWRKRPEPWPQRERVITNFWIMGMNYDQIAVMEGIPKKTPKGSKGPSAYRLMKKAMDELRAELGVKDERGDP